MSLPICAVLLVAASAQQPADLLSTAYEAVVQRYRSGDRKAAIVEMRGWPEWRVKDEIQALEALWEGARPCPGCTAAEAWRRTPVRAALMLHTDCAREARRQGQSPRLHESAAAAIARMLTDDSAHRVFARRWYEAMAGIAQGENGLDEALSWAERGVRDFPDSAEMQLVLGEVAETIGALAAPGSNEDAPFDPGTRAGRANIVRNRDSRDLLARAQRALRAAAAADPSLLEARLRLGRVAWRLGETAEARSALLGLLDGRPAPETALLAHLFLGRLDEDAGRLGDAARAYEAALAIDGRAQAARIALSHVRLRQGDAPSARAEAEKAIGFAGFRLHPDPFWLYPWGPSVGLEEKLEALRREASS